MRDLDVCGDAAQVGPVCRFGQIPNFDVVIYGGIVVLDGIAQGDGVVRDARNIGIPGNRVKSGDNYNQTIRVSVGDMLPLILRVDVVVIPTG